MTIENLVKDKSVCLTGPGFVPNDLGKKIDSFDVVIRINTIPNLDENSVSKKIGSRTDVIYYDGSFPQDRLPSYLKINPSFVRCTYPKGEWFFKSRIESNIPAIEKKLNFSLVDDDVYFELKELCRGTRPNSGLISIFDLLNTNLKKLFIVGIDSYRSAYASYVKSSISFDNLKDIKNLFIKGDNGDFHDPDIQYKVLKNLISQDDRIKLPDYMKKIINNKKLDNLFSDL